MNKAEFIEKYGEEAYKKIQTYNREYSRKYYQKHKEKRRERSKKYYQNHKEHFKEYRQKHKEKYREYRKEYYQNHKEIYNKYAIEEAKRQYVKFGTAGRTRGQVMCIETGEIFENSAEASRSVGLNIRAVCTAIHRNIRAGGYHWKYLEDENET